MARRHWTAIVLCFQWPWHSGTVAVDTGQHRRKHQMQNYFRIPLLLLLKEPFKGTNAILNVAVCVERISQTFPYQCRYSGMETQRVIFHSRSSSQQCVRVGLMDLWGARLDRKMKLHHPETYYIGSSHLARVLGKDEKRASKSRSSWTAEYISIQELNRLGFGHRSLENAAGVKRRISAIQKSSQVY
jgi:hypothetical protein